MHQTRLRRQPPPQNGGYTIARHSGWTVLALGLALAAPAGAAEDLSGSYAGKLSCKGLANGVAEKGKQDITIVQLTNLTLIADGVAKAGSDKATLKGSLTDTTGKTRILDCTFSVKRTATTPAKFQGCILE